MLILALAGPLYQMHMHNTLAQRALYIEPEAQVFSAPLVRLGGAADVAITGQPRPGSLAVCGNLT
jgi:hypothetical protein